MFFDPIPEAATANGSTDLLAQVFGQGGTGDELLSASGSTRHNIAVGRQYHEDAQGTIEATTEIAGAAGGTVGSGGSAGSGGSVQSAFAVDAWGNELSASLGTGQDGRSVEDNPFLFLGGLGYWQEPDLGLSYVRARWLDTSNAQWMSVDPVEGEPRYSYAANKPSNQIDPKGTQSDDGFTSQEISTWREKVRNTKGRYPLFVTSRKNNPGIVSWAMLGNQEQKSLVNALLQPYYGQIRTSAKKNCIPIWLLANVILTELLDISSFDLIEENELGFDVIAPVGHLLIYHSPATDFSIGLGQLYLRRALNVGEWNIGDIPKGLHSEQPLALVDITTAELKKEYKREVNALTVESPVDNKEVDRLVQRGLLDSQVRREVMLKIAFDKLGQAPVAIEAVAREIARIVHVILNQNQKNAIYYLFSPGETYEGKLSRKELAHEIEKKLCDNPDYLLSLDWPMYAFDAKYGMTFTRFFSDYKGKSSTILGDKMY